MTTATTTKILNDTVWGALNNALIFSHIYLEASSALLEDQESESVGDHINALVDARFEIGQSLSVALIGFDGDDSEDRENILNLHNWLVTYDADGSELDQMCHTIELLTEIRDHFTTSDGSDDPATEIHGADLPGDVHDDVYWTRGEDGNWVAS